MYIDERLAIWMCAGITVIVLACIGLIVICSLLKEENGRYRKYADKIAAERIRANREDMRQFIKSSAGDMSVGGRHERSGGDVQMQ